MQAHLKMKLFEREAIGHKWLSKYTQNDSIQKLKKQHNWRESVSTLRSRFGELEKCFRSNESILELRDSLQFGEGHRNSLRSFAHEIPGTSRHFVENLTLQ